MLSSSMLHGTDKELLSVKERTAGWKSRTRHGPSLFLNYMQDLKKIKAAAKKIDL